MAYYKVIDGKKYDAGLLEAAEKAVAGEKNPIISAAEAEILFNLVKDGNSYTEIEKNTMSYIRKNYKWTDKADAWFRSEIRKWAATK